VRVYSIAAILPRSPHLCQKTVFEFNLQSGKQKSRVSWGRQSC
jgi:hypothetical protein